MILLRNKNGAASHATANLLREPASTSLESASALCEAMCVAATNPTHGVPSTSAILLSCEKTGSQDIRTTLPQTALATKLSETGSWWGTTHVDHMDCAGPRVGRLVRTWGIVAAQALGWQRALPQDNKCTSGIEEWKVPAAGGQQHQTAAALVSARQQEWKVPAAGGQ